jgi:methionine synthase II (cobalamin-independent)
MYFESTEIMVRRLMTLLDKFGEEKIAYVGPECGLSSFPNYEIAINYLQKIAKVANLKG